MATVGFRFRVPAAEWGEAWAKAEFGEQWNTSFIDAEVIEVKAGPPPKYVVRYPDFPGTDEEWDEWRITDPALQQRAREDRHVTVHPVSDDDEDEPPSSSDEAPLSTLREKRLPRYCVCVTTRLVASLALELAACRSHMLLPTFTATFPLLIIGRAAVFVSL